MSGAQGPTELRIETWWAQRLLVLVSALPLPVIPVTLGLILETHCIHNFPLPVMALISLALLVPAIRLLRDVAPPG